MIFVTDYKKVSRPMDEFSQCVGDLSVEFIRRFGAITPALHGTFMFYISAYVLFCKWFPHEVAVGMAVNSVYSRMNTRARSASFS